MALKAWRLPQGQARVASSVAPRTGACIKIYNRARNVTSQLDPIQELAEGLPEQPTPPMPEDAPGVLSAEKYTSIGQLKEVLLGLGPNNPEAYDRLKRSVKEEDQDSTVEALTKFFQGSPQALCFIYDRLVEAGNADPIDREIVERVMEKLPQTNEDKKQANASGLFVPKVCVSSSAMEKTADRMSEPYLMNGGNDNRFCPKTRNLVSTYLCRFHCLDGLAIDDAQILCGEAIWRQAVMDKFSREYKDKDGKWKGGYLRKRFIVHQDESGRPYQLKPGHRAAPIHEDAWSIEKRLQEMRRSEGSKRGYSATPGDPKDLYNFDPHKTANTPDSKELAEKKRDPIAKNSSVKTFNLKKALYEGDASTVEDVTTSKRCTRCGQDNAMNVGVCVRKGCGGTEFVNKTKSETEVASKTSSQPEFMPNINAGIKAANGVYMASDGGRVAFGDTENQANSRMAIDMGGIDADPTLDEENSALLQMRQEPVDVVPGQDDMTPTTEEGMGEPIPNTTGEQAPEVGKTPLPDPLDEGTGEGLPQPESILDPANPLDSTAIESQQQAQQAEEQGPEAYQASPDFTPADALDEGELLGLGEDSPAAVEP
jgi:hypothetical protein